MWSPVLCFHRVLAMRALGLWLLIAGLSWGCGHTVITSTQPNVKLYLDGEFVGQGRAEVRRMGFPGKMTLEARRDDEVLARQQLSRQFTPVTLIAGIFTCYTGLLWGWQYPKEVEVFVPSVEKGRSSGKSAWDIEDSGSVWDRAPGE